MADSMVYRVEVAFDFDDPGIRPEPGPYSINTWHFSNVADDDFYGSASIAKSILIGDIYTFETTQYLASFLHPEVRFRAVLEGGSIDSGQAPIFDLGTATMEFSAEANLPSECAVVLSAETGPYGTIKRQSRLNRVFFGPLAGPAVVASAGAITRVNPDFCEQLGAAAVDLMEEDTSAGKVNWAIFSPKNGTYQTPMGGWVDNELDTQRRRGTGATARHPWPS